MACIMNRESAERIHLASLDLLENPGVKMEHDGVRDLLLRNGARAGTGAEVVVLPREMVTECLERCPKEFALTDRSGSETVLSATADPVIWSCPGMNIRENGATRPFTSDDMARTSRLLDRLENVQGVFGMAMKDVPPPARDVVGLSIMARNTRKHIRAFCFTPEGGETMAEMRRVVGGHPWFSIGFTAHGPLRWTNLALSIFQATSGHGIPVTVNGEPMAGTSSPVTLAGAAAVGNAEILAGIVAVQLMEPGRPCIHNLGLAHTFDMRTMIAVTGGPENALLADAAAALGRFYGLPSASWVSTESMCCDAQAAMEKMFGFYTHMAAGVTNLWGVGQLESEMTFSPAQAMIDNEMVSYARRYLRGIEVTDDTLAVDLARTVGIGGSYLDRMHTAEHFKTELFMPDLLLRSSREGWEADGSKPLDRVAEERAARLMEDEADCGMSKEQVGDLQGIADDFLKRR
jgi:trimethylamine--corrinoid protein Co-methyltransferase